VVSAPVEHGNGHPISHLRHHLGNAIPLLVALAPLRKDQIAFFRSLALAGIRRVVVQIKAIEKNDLTASSSRPPPGANFGDQGFGFGVKDLGFRVQGIGCRVQGAEYRVGCFFRV